ncbi:MAG: hypothetical protein LAT63_07525 [Marinobacter sp.]|nr:hypothetical protein [Marinobacter sp.]
MFERFLLGGSDPFMYRLQDLWLDLYQAPWAIPQDKEQLLTDLSVKVASGELFIYRETDLSSLGPGHYERSGPGAPPEPPEDAPRTSTVSPAEGGARSGSVSAIPVAGAALGGLAMAQDKAVHPTSLEECIKILEKRRTEIAEKGYQPKYTDDELYEMAQSGQPVNDRFVVRFSPAPSVDGNTVEPENYDGPMAHERNSGRHPLWMSTFDQIEAADTDPALIAAVFGTRYEPDKDYVLYIVDRGEDHETNGSDVFVPTFENMRVKLKSEFAGELDPEMIDKVMTEEYALEFRQHWSDFNVYLAESGLDWKKSFETDNAEKFAKDNPNMSKEDKVVFLTRHAVLAEIGAFEVFTGNGLTERYDEPGRPGALETLDIQHNPDSLKESISGGKVKAIKMPGKKST